jgi:hypothetical protein
MTSQNRKEALKIFGTWAAGTAAGTYFVVWNNGGALEALGKFVVPADLPGRFAVSAALPAGAYEIGTDAKDTGAVAVYDGVWEEHGEAKGAWSVGKLNPGITATLGSTRDNTSTRIDLSR